MFRASTAKSAVRSSSPQNPLTKRSNNTMGDKYHAVDEKKPFIIHNPKILPPGVKIPRPISKSSIHTSKFRSQIIREQQRIVPSSTDELMDVFLQKATKLPINEAVESLFHDQFQARNVIYWEAIPSLKLLFSPSTLADIPELSGLVGYTFFSKEIIVAQNPPAHPSFHPTVDSNLLPVNAPVMLFPLFNQNNEPIAVVEVIRPVNSDNFSSEDLDIAKWFQIKFSYLASWVYKDTNIDAIMKIILPISNNAYFLSQVRTKLADMLGARSFEIWSFNKDSREMIRYDDEARSISHLNSGVAGAAIIEETVLNVVNTRFHNKYNETLDGTHDTPALIVPYIDESNIVWGLVLRGALVGSFFCNGVAEKVKRIAPYLIFSIKNSNYVTGLEKELEKSRLEGVSLSSIISTTQDVSKELTTQKLFEIIMEKGRELTKSDRCSLFIVSKSKDHMISYLNTEPDKSYKIPINHGVAGRTYLTSAPIKIDDAYSCEFFNRSDDTRIGYKTQSILSVPINDASGNVIGIIQMVNKKDGMFNDTDVIMIQQFNVLCGIFIGNSRKYEESVESSKKLRSIFETTMSLGKSGSIHHLLEDIIQNARASIGAEHAVLWAIDEPDHVFRSLVFTDSDKIVTIPIASGLAGQCYLSKESIVSNNAQTDMRINKNYEKMIGFPVNNMISVPVISSSGSVIGVVEMINKETGNFTRNEASLVDSFAIFSAIALENQRIKEISHSIADLDKDHYMNESESCDLEIPPKLKMTTEQEAVIMRRDCFQPDFSDDDRIRELFFFFNRYNLLKNFNIPADLLFRFIFAIRGTYSEVPYHNWIHAVDVTQYLVFLLEKSQLSQVFTPFEKLAMLIASICHDANHNGFNNTYNEMAQMPLGILFKDMSILETYHCAVAIGIISKQQTNILHSLKDDELSNMWNLIINMVTATDMKNHFQIINKTTEILNNNMFSLDNPECRLLVMQILIKASDISNVSRPFDIANKWCDILNEEFFRQGDNEKKLGFGFTSPLNDRVNSKKPKAQIGFYNFICFPLYNLITRIFPQLQITLDALKSNLESWKSFVDKQ